MKKLLCAILGLAGLLTLAPSLNAQAIGFVKKSDIEAGAGLSVISPDYTQYSGTPLITGISFWGTYNLNRLIGVDAIGHLGIITTPGDFSENSFVVGPKISYHRRAASVYGTVRVGIESLTSTASDPFKALQNKSNPAFGQSPYGVIAFGGGVEYQLKRKIKLRVIDVEVQKLNNFEPRTLSPIVYTFGVSYVIR